jgi:hypothetical protein
MIIDIPGVSDRRQTPRYEIRLPVDMVLATGNILTVTTRNISSSGLQVICDAWVMDEIDPRGIQSHAISQLRLKAVIELPIENETNKLYANCRIKSVQRMSQDEYMLNLVFIDFENGSDTNLDKFLAQYEQKKTVVDIYA